MKEIILSRGMITLVDDEDFEYINQWKWCARKNKNMWYAQRTINSDQKTIQLHRFILGITDPNIFTDRIDRNGLNNQRSNLRMVTQSQNEANKVSHKNSTSKYKGVCWDKKLSKWVARICKDRKNIYLGHFDNEIDAALAYNNAARKIHVEFAKLNELI